MTLSQNEIRALFAEAGVSVSSELSGETEAERIDRIFEELKSGARTEEQLRNSIQGIAERTAGTTQPEPTSAPGTTQPVSSDIWTDLVNARIIQGDPNYYSSGQASESEFSNAISVAFKGTEPGSDLRKGLIDFLFASRGAQGDPNYWYNLPSDSAEVSSLTGLSINGTTTQPTTTTAPGAQPAPEPGAQPISGDIWANLVNAGVIQGDPDYYSSGQATADEFSNAISTAFKGTQPGSSLRKGLIDFLFSKGGAQGDPNYWYNLPSDSAEVSNLMDLSVTINISAGGEDVEIKALPRNSRLVNVNGENRVIWDLGDGLGHAWYTINDTQLQNLYGENWQAYVTETFGTEGAYNAKYGDYYWGNVAEIDLTSDNPWEDLKARTFAAFGYVAGFDDPDVRRLILQGHFENWSSNEFFANYQQTDFYRNTTETQRQWGRYGPEERSRRINTRAASLVEEYRRQWGVDPIGGINNEEILAAAEQIESGQISSGEWSHNNRQAAENAGNTPAARAVTDRQREQGKAGVTIENRGGYARERWEYWMGSTPLPSGFANEWGRNLYMNINSEDDLETSLRELSAGTWANKPENLGWSEWAAPVKSNIRNILEMSTVDDSDPLLSMIMDRGLSGYDATLAIRQDQRFRSTNRMFDELSRAASSLGRTFGFIA